MSPGENSNSWNEYSKLVLKELETLASSIDTLTTEISGLKSDIASIKAREDKVTELREWKAKLDEVTSPAQLKVHIEKIDRLEKFQIRSITALAVVQAILGLGAAIYGLLK